MSGPSGNGRGFASKNKTARILRISRHGVQREIECGHLGLVEVGGQRLIPLEQVERRYAELYGECRAPAVECVPWRGPGRAA